MKEIIWMNEWPIPVQGFLRVINTRNGGQERKFDGGAMQLSERMAAELPTGTVRLSSPVVRVDQLSGDGVTVTAGGGSTYTAQYAISAVPQASDGSVMKLV